MSHTCTCLNQEYTFAHTTLTVFDSSICSRTVWPFGINNSIVAAVLSPSSKKFWHASAKLLLHFFSNMLHLSSEAPVSAFICATLSPCSPSLTGDRLADSCLSNCNDRRLASSTVCLPLASSSSVFWSFNNLCTHM
eukprot:GHVS01034158.1.p1 GENE.GHVS01034158.1~~GHVS01034158.1.p1  ORF type:complete len:136 (-),score=7.69 GHVS01034158.1:298-705(-)